MSILDLDDSRLLQYFYKFRRRLAEDGKIRDRKHGLRCYRQCFTGRDACDVIVSLFSLTRPQQCEQLGNAFMDKGLMVHVTHAHRFRDKGYYYQLTNFKRASRRYFPKNVLQQVAQDYDDSCDDDNSNNLDILNYHHHHHHHQSSNNDDDGGGALSSMESGHKLNTVQSSSSSSVLISPRGLVSSLVSKFTRGGSNSNNNKSSPKAIPPAAQRCHQFEQNLSRWYSYGDMCNAMGSSKSSPFNKQATPPSASSPIAVSPWKRHARSRTESDEMDVLSSTSSLLLEDDDFPSRERSVSDTSALNALSTMSISNTTTRGSSSSMTLMSDHSLSSSPNPSPHRFQMPALDMGKVAGDNSQDAEDSVVSSVRTISPKSSVQHSATTSLSSSPRNVNLIGMSKSRTPVASPHERFIVNGVEPRSTPPVAALSTSPRTSPVTNLMHKARSRVMPESGQEEDGSDYAPPPMRRKVTTPRSAPSMPRLRKTHGRKQAVSYWKLHCHWFVAREYTLDEVLHSETLRSILLDFAREEYADENVIFWEDIVLRFKKIPRGTAYSDQVQAMASELYRKYFTADAEYALNVSSSDIRQCTEMFLTKDTHRMFDRILTLVMHHLSDIYERMLKSVSEHVRKKQTEALYAEQQQLLLR